MKKFDVTIVGADEWYDGHYCGRRSGAQVLLIEKSPCWENY